MQGGVAVCLSTALKKEMKKRLKTIKYNHVNVNTSGLLFNTLTRRGLYI